MPSPDSEETGVCERGGRKACACDGVGEGEESRLLQRERGVLGVDKPDRGDIGSGDELKGGELGQGAVTFRAVLFLAKYQSALFCFFVRASSSLSQRWSAFNTDICSVSLSHSL